MSRTLINVDDRLLEEAMELTGKRRKVDVVNEALRVLVEQRRLARRFERLRGRVAWDGDVDTMRHGRSGPR